MPLDIPSHVVMSLYKQSFIIVIQQRLLRKQYGNICNHAGLIIWNFSRPASGTNSNEANGFQLLQGASIDGSCRFPFLKAILLHYTMGGYAWKMADWVDEFK